MSRAARPVLWVKELFTLYQVYASKELIIEDACLPLTCFLPVTCP